MAILLRGHHLICLHFFAGQGYDKTFVENLKKVIAAAEAAGAEVHNGADAVCEQCPSLRRSPHSRRCMHSPQAEDEIALLDARALHLLHLSPGQHIQWHDIRALLPSLFHEWYSLSCNGCEWQWACVQKALYRELRDRGRSFPQMPGL